MPFSYSQLSLYRTCPRQFEFANVKKIPRQISAGESFGSSVHNTLKKWGELEVQKQPKEAPNQLALFTEPQVGQAVELTLEKLVELWHSSFIVEGYETRADAEAARTKGEKIMQHVFDWWAKRPRQVAAIETGFRLQSPDGYEVSGRFDRVETVEGGVQVIDFKTGKFRTQQQVDEDLQLSMYALAAEAEFQKPCTELCLLFIHEDGVTEVTTKRTKQQLEEAIAEMDKLVEGIDNEDFAPTPSTKVCGYCPYRGICDAAQV